MIGYLQVKSESDMKALLALMSGFHDSMAKEVHIVNRGYVQSDSKMVMCHRFDLQLLIQSQFKPNAIEMVFSGTESVAVRDASEFWGATGSVVQVDSPVERTLISMSFDSQLTVTCSKLFYQVRPDWVGAEARLTHEVPGHDATSALLIGDGWRQCQVCYSAWQAPGDPIFSYCYGCRNLTQLVDQMK